MYNTRRCAYAGVPCDGLVVRTVIGIAGKAAGKQPTERREA